VRVLREAGINPSRTQAVGFADARPLVKEIDTVSRRKKRRIEMLLYPSQFKIKTYRPGGPVNRPGSGFVRSYRTVD
jgi:chemotaxis protein MotB